MALITDADDAVAAIGDGRVLVRERSRLTAAEGATITTLTAAATGNTEVRSVPPAT